LTTSILFPDAGRRFGRLGGGDTLVSQKMLDHTVDDILRRVRLDRQHDVPYLAGYSRDGKTIYIDRHIPRTFQANGRRIPTDRYLILHEAVEKCILTQLHLVYQHAHQIALRAEQAAVKAAKVRWRDYNRFMEQYIKEAGDERLDRLPPDLDIKPYRDEHDYALLHRMQAAMKKPTGRRGPQRSKASACARRAAC
jgi:hypothetical protein